MDEPPKGFLGKFVNVLKGKKKEGEDENMGDDDQIMSLNIFKNMGKSKKKKRGSDDEDDDDDDDNEGSGSDEEKPKKKNKKKKRKVSEDDEDEGEDSEEDRKKASQKKAALAKKNKANGKKAADLPIEVENKKALKKNLLQDEDEVNTWAQPAKDNRKGKQQPALERVASKKLPPQKPVKKELEMNTTKTNGRSNGIQEEAKSGSDLSESD